MKSFIASVIVLTMLILFASCAPKSTPATKSSQLALQDQAQVLVDKDIKGSEWDRVLGAAKREGQLNLIGSMGGAPGRAALIEGFGKKFGISMDVFVGMGDAISARILQERNVGIYYWDIYVGGPGTPNLTLKPAKVFDPIDPLLFLEEATNPKAWFGGNIAYSDKDHQILLFTSYTKPPIGINTKLVKPDEIKSYKDLLDPKWKGKIAMNNPTIRGTGSKWASVVGWSVTGWDYMRELAKLEPAIVSNDRLLVEWLAQGKYSIAIAPDTSPMTEFKNAGAPVTFIMPVEGTYSTSGHGAVALVNKAPHLNAAKAFVNWLLTKEGQTIWTLETGEPSRRIDVPTEHLDPASILNPNAKYYDSAIEEWYKIYVEQEVIARQVFGSLVK